LLIYERDEEELGWRILAEKSMKKLWNNKDDRVWDNYVKELDRKPHPLGCSSSLSIQSTSAFPNHGF